MPNPTPERETAPTRIKILSSYEGIRSNFDHGDLPQFGWTAYVLASEHERLRSRYERAVEQIRGITDDFNPAPGQEALALDEMREALGAFLREHDALTTEPNDG